MLDHLDADETSHTMRELTVDEVESVSGGTTYPPSDGCTCGKNCPG